MGKMKELFMKTNFPNGDWDIEREYLFNDELVREREYEEYQALMNSSELNKINTKIEVKDGRNTSIEVNTEGEEHNKCFETLKHGF